MITDKISSVTLYKNNSQFPIQNEYTLQFWHFRFLDSSGLLCLLYTKYPKKVVYNSHFLHKKVPMYKDFKPKFDYSHNSNTRYPKSRNIWKPAFLVSGMALKTQNLD